MINNEHEKPATRDVEAQKEAPDHPVYPEGGWEAYLTVIGAWLIREFRFPCGRHTVHRQPENKC